MRVESALATVMCKTLVRCCWMLALATSALVGQNPSAKSPQQALPSGVLIPHQTCGAVPTRVTPSICHHTTLRTNGGRSSTPLTRTVVEMYPSNS